MRLPAAFTDIPQYLAACNLPPTSEEIDTANAVRREYLIEGWPLPYMSDVVRAFRIAKGANVYIEVGTQDKGNIAWLARTALAPGATIIDIDQLEYPDNDRKIQEELKDKFDYHSIRGDCLSDSVLADVRSILAGRSVDVIFCDSHYTYSHTLTEFSLYYPLLRRGGYLLFHDASWRGDLQKEGEEAQKGKALAVEQLDRFYPAYMVIGDDTPLHRPVPSVNREGYWATLSIFPKPFPSENQVTAVGQPRPVAPGISKQYRLRSPLKPFGRKVTSQNDEDGIIEAIFSDVAPASRFFVEFGVGPNWLDKDYTGGLEGNCVALRERGWSGLFMDGGQHPERFGVEREFITPLNINTLLRRYGVPRDVDVISIDVDGQDFWIWMACDYRPSLFIVEINPNFEKLHDSFTTPFDSTFRWDTTNFYGASLGALIKLGNDKGYKLVYSNGTNAFFLRSDLLANPQDFPESAFHICVPMFPEDPQKRSWTPI